MTYASPADVSVELGRPASSADESAQWQAWLDRVERSIVRGFLRAGRTLAAEVTLLPTLADDVRDVEVGRVIDKIQNPNAGQTSVTRAVDDASVTYRREGSAVGDPLELTDADWSSLLPNDDRGAFSTRPGFTPDYVLPTYPIA